MIVCALGLERKALVTLLNSPQRHAEFSYPVVSGTCGRSQEFRVCVVQCGVGSSVAINNICDFLDRIETRHLLIAGLCGSLCSRFRVSEVFSPNAIVSTENESLITCDSFMGLNQDELLLSSSHPIVTAEARQEWSERTGAIGVDMESYALAKLARERGLSVSVIRAVSDDLETELDSRFIHLLKKSGEPNYLQVIWNIVRSPVLLPILYAMNDRAHLAMRAIVGNLQKCDLTKKFQSHLS